MVRRMRLQTITPENYEAALALSVRPDQEDLVAPVVKSLAEAYVYPDHAWPRLIYDGDMLVGFLMAFLDIPWNPERDPDDRRSGLWRLNIAAERSGPEVAPGRTSPGSPGPADRNPSTSSWASGRPARRAAARPSPSSTFDMASRPVGPRRGDDETGVPAAG
jgi:hypothetical protein